MTSPVPRHVVQAFYQAYASRDPARIGPFLDDEIEWMISGPVDLLKFCGQHKGKAAVVEFFARLVPEVLDIRGFEPDELLIDGDRAAALGRLIATQNGSERVISYRIGHFLRFRGEKLVSFRSLIDSFDLAEQLIGHRIDLSKHLPQTDIPGDLVAV